ncbi:uncharacterized protein P174DRAFT_164218 [Aspergillus novofumigatus IBT 16806]|uniref:Uncharacterized protein n=1 Tax=Aspergillus novofumigatus (strain IBT 16806) TaxID=1392255 RepID=A0A2I1C8H9_ASPN1|nr:uncharacterized protein P174DRAFT_164218 [Aspergillus novofumigatus IBT 16806]PKX93891.1 hypothetical protein P174DRAFT_164218 [Aspergillus novofumigatus IBT 16806]
MTIPRMLYHGCLCQKVMESETVLKGRYPDLVLPFHTRTPKLRFTTLVLKLPLQPGPYRDHESSSPDFISPFKYIQIIREQGSKDAGNLLLLLPSKLLKSKSHIVGQGARALTARPSRIIWAVDLRPGNINLCCIFIQPVLVSVDGLKVHQIQGPKATSLSSSGTSPLNHIYLTNGRVRMPSLASTTSMIRKMRLMCLLLPNFHILS